ncbi:MAG: RNA polymerase sigma factor [Bacteroidota bacterium]
MSSDFFKTSILPFAGIIIKICRAYTHTQEDFEDYYQEVCLQIWRSRNRFQQQSEWSTWIYRLTLNVCLTLQKKKRIATTPIEGTAAHAATTSTSNQADIDRLYAAIRQLPEIDRAIILLYLEEKSYKEIAQIIEISASNVGVRINRIKQKLKKLLDG